jgi:hypothetical protein
VPKPIWREFVAKKSLDDKITIEAITSNIFASNMDFNRKLKKKKHLLLELEISKK